ncbi:Fc.00g094430.m01.CDS01 [Cosmosporella sp. VM-42]
MGGFDFNPDKDISSLEGKVILITGGSDGLGKATALALSKHNPSQVWIAARNAQKAGTAIAEIKRQTQEVSVNFLELDLGSFDSIKNAARTFLASVTRLDLLFFNAGIMATAAGLTKDGYEVQFGTNHVGHALLMKFLTPLLINTATSLSSLSNVRLIVLSSSAHKFSVSGGINYGTLKNKAEKVSTFNRYGQSKLANAAYAHEISKRCPQFTTVSVHPGAVKTELNKPNRESLFLRVSQALVLPFIGLTPQNGAKSQLWAATSTKVVSGEYYEPVGVLGKGSSLIKNVDFGARLWEWTAKELEGQEM